MNYEALYSRNRNIHNLVREYFENYGNVLKWRGYKENILQDGCVEGTLTKVLFPFVESHVLKLVAIDDKEGMIDEAKKHNQLEGVEYRTVDIENDDVSLKVNEKFDHIFSFFLSTYRTNTRNLLKQFSKILNPNGQIFIQIMTDSSIHKAMVKAVGDEKWSKYLPSKVVFADYTDNPIKYFRNEAETAGFKVELCEIEKKNFVTDHCWEFAKTIQQLHYKNLNRIPIELQDSFLQDYISALCERSIYLGEPNRYEFPFEAMICILTKV